MYENLSRTTSYVLRVLVSHFKQYNADKLLCKLALMSLQQGKSKQSRCSVNFDVHIPKGLANNESHALPPHTFRVCLLLHTTELQFEALAQFGYT
jgi:hypothetical protein